MPSAGSKPTTDTPAAGSSGPDGTATSGSAGTPPSSTIKRWKKRGIALLARILPGLYVRYLRLVERTSYIDSRELTDIIDRRLPAEHLAFALLHQDILALPWFFRGRGITALAQRTDAGDIISAVLERIGFVAARGGTSASARRRVPVVQQMIKDAVDSGGSVVAVTPDGSSGPAGVVRPGIAYFALRTGATVYCVKLAASRSWFAPTWDRTQIPLPFSRMRVCVSEPHVPPRDKATLGDFEGFRLAVERSLHTLHYRAFAEHGRAPVPILRRLSDVEAAERAARAAGRSSKAKLPSGREQRTP
jgi:lysophospholipid acyltransferase (LPLAT)-like uncharacterized protein